MSKYVEPKKLYIGKTFDEIKNLFHDHVWEKIPNLEISAYASSKGLIFRESYKVAFGSHDITKPSILFDCNNTFGVYTRAPYLRGGKHTKAHQYILEAFVIRVDRPEVNHKDCNKGNNFINNLEWMTRKENAIHAVSNGRFPKHLNLSEDERKRRGNQLREVNRKMKLGIIPRKINHVLWSDERKQKYREYLKTRHRDNCGRFIKEVVPNENQR